MDIYLIGKLILTAIVIFAIGLLAGASLFAKMLEKQAPIQEVVYVNNPIQEKRKSGDEDEDSNNSFYQ